MRADSWIHIVALTAILLGSCLGSHNDEASHPTGQPNFILVVVDALRKDHLGVYGYDKPTSPFLDSIAEEGAVFDRAYAHGSQTFNSTASLLTSSYFPVVVPRRAASSTIRELPQEAAEHHARLPLIADVNPTIAEIFQAGGYQTVGLFTNPHHHSTSGFWQGFQQARYLQPEKRALPYARASRIHRAFFEWFDDERSEEPFFAYLHFMDVHHPYRPPRFVRRQFVEGKGRALYVDTAAEEVDDETFERDLRFTIALYDAEIRFVDLVLENIFIDLEKRDALSRTFVVVTSDHGDEFMDRGGFGHGKHLAPEMIHVPLFAWGPGVVPRRESRLVRQIDLAPTLAELAGVARPVDLEGVSLASLLLGPAPGFSDRLSTFAWINEKQSLTTARWHLTSAGGSGSIELFDLDQDPTAQQDVAAEHPEVTATLTGELDRIAALRRASIARSAELARQPAASETPSIDPEIEAQLEALGYLDQ